MRLGTLIRLGWDRLSAAILIAVGAVAVILGWIGVSGADLPSKQLPYLVSGGIGGLYILGVAALLWLSGDLRDEWSRLGEIKTMLGTLSGTGTDLVDTEVLGVVEPLRTEPAPGVAARAR
jgi:hypothetical protein